MTSGERKMLLHAKWIEKQRGVRYSESVIESYENIIN